MAKLPGSVLKCTKHTEPVKFICTAKNCGQELCSFCILEHQIHIHWIQTIDHVLEEARRFYRRTDPMGLADSVLSNQNANIRELDGLSSEVLAHFKDKLNTLRKEIIEQDRRLIENVSSKEYFLEQNKELMGKRIPLERQHLQSLLNYLTSEQVAEPAPVKVETSCLLYKFSDLFDDCMKASRCGVHPNSTEHNVPKVAYFSFQILHWFEWNKKRLHIYDILKNSSRIVDLEINFKVPSYSRSVLTPTGQIFLMGGEEPEMNTRDDVYMYDITLAEPNNNLHIRVSWRNQRLRCLRRSTTSRAACSTASSM